MQAAGFKMLPNQFVRMLAFLFVNKVDIYISVVL